MLDWEVPSQTVKAFAGLIAQRNNLSHTELGVVSVRQLTHSSFPTHFLTACSS